MDLSNPSPSDHLLQKVTVIRDWNSTTSSILSVFDNVKTVALDVEGVDLGRDGCICLIQLATHDHCVLFDILNKKLDDPVIIWLKTMLQDENITKIVHDCRMDADALKHIAHIHLTNVHDTSCWHHVLHGVEDANLNAVLKSNGLKENKKRDASVYNNNHEFWKQRPLTQQMIEWASGDIQGLFKVYDLQTSAPESQQVKATALSDEFVNFGRNARVATIQVRNSARFIGSGGCKIRNLKSKTNTLLYHRGDRSKNNWMVYYTTDAQLNQVIQTERGNR